MIPPVANPLIQMGNVTVTPVGNCISGRAPTRVNSLTLVGNGKIIALEQRMPVIFKVKGQGVATPIDLTAVASRSVARSVELAVRVCRVLAWSRSSAERETAALVYAPNAEGEIAGGADFYGSIVVNKIKATGGSAINYDRRLQRMMMTTSNWMMTSFTWKTF